jgi:regulator of sirC expression with transglutaminase-like and TPR domain
LDFSALARLPDDRIDVLTGALLIAKDEYPRLDVGRYRDLVDELAEPLGILAGLRAEEQADRVSELLFGQLGFRGNRDDYYDTRNSFLNDVLDRRLGIPISLSVVYVEVARRAGVQASGVGFPGHFLVRVERDSGEPIVVDPFSGGRVVGKSTLESMAEENSKARRLARSLIAPATPREILVRMVTNLKGIYASRGESARVLIVQSRIIELLPDSAAEVRDRALLAMRLGAPRLARQDIARYIELSPDASDLAEMRRLLTGLEVTERPYN